MKRFKLQCHNKVNEDSILLNPKDFQSISVGSIVEIHPPEGEYSPLLLQVNENSLTSDLPHKDTIIIEQSIAITFQLKQHPEVIVNVVEDTKAISLDSVEITFKDQYLARSDMWRLKKCLVNTCVYLNKKLEIYGIRCQIFEMYCQGEKVSSGIVTEDTKIVYRSASSMVYLFIQMSCEMWHFDINGDLYFEKAIDGFLPDLFTKWKKFSCNHDVTIVLFSRTFYEAQSSEEFPPYMRECLQQDYKGRFFEDFYRIAVQNERYDEWSSTIIALKKLFNQYQDAVLRYHERPDIKIPKAVNSTSSQGNFLEVLNMSLNVFEKHYMDRSFDRTGQLSIVISPGVGMFEVDRELTIITKQRIIDNGIGSDLVCLGEQPLHAVPLFKFHNKKVVGNPHSIADDYNMPHWINLSFYASSKQPSYLNFIPRVKLPIPLPEENKENNLNDSLSNNRSRHYSQPDPSFPVLFDYDEYDSQVFKLPVHIQVSKNTNSLQRPRRRKGTPPNQSHSVGAFTVHHPVIEESTSIITSSDPSPLSVSHASSAAIAIPRRSSHTPSAASSFQNSSDADTAFLHPRQYSKDDTDPELTPPFRTIAGSAGGSCENQFAKQILSRRPKALINPFDPSHITIKLTSNRRRWTHVFPLGPTGIFMQQHHYQAIPQISASTLISLAAESAALSPENLLHYRNTISSLELDGSFDSKIGVVGKIETLFSASNVNLCGLDGNAGLNHSNLKSPASNMRASTVQAPGSQTARSLSWLWGATGEQEWTPAMTTGVDWKSLVIPACLPITTDYFPDIRSLQNDYVLCTYFLLPEDIIAENSRPKFYQNEEERPHRTLTTQEVYTELICQRLQQGFQIILLSKQNILYPHTQAGTSPQFTPTIVGGRKQVEDMEEYLLSIGRIFHRLTLDGGKITVVVYRPRHPYREIKIRYCYRFHAPDSDSYGVSWVNFTSEKLENYTWNFLDNYICMKGEGEFELKESLKFWRLRILVLPEGQVATKKIIDGSEFCDLYKEFSPEERAKQQAGFLKFVEILNGIRRLTPKPIKNLNLGPRRSSLGQSVLSQLVSNSSRDFRDRVSSNRIHDRPRFRSQSAKNGARVETPMVTGRISPAFEVDSKLTNSNSSLETPLEGGEGFDDVEVKKLNQSSSLQDIIDVMKTNGLNFLLKIGLPTCTFISAEAVSWAIENIEGITTNLEAIALFQEMINEGFICHASCIKKYPFVYGFYLYYIVPPLERGVSRALLFDMNDSEFIYLFQRDWLEVQLHPLLPSSFVDPLCLTSGEICAGQAENHSKLKFKTTNVQIDEGLRSNRQEWGQARYQNIYKPYEAFEMVLEWMVATGNIAADMVLGWARKALSFGLQLVPIPSDPFALPFLPDSDPLRGPIFIPLDLLCITENLMQNLDNNSIQLLQEKILCKFGFLLYPNPDSPYPLRYVHISGSMFIMLPEFQRERKSISQSTPAMDLHHVSSPHDEYITRHFSGVKRKRSPMLNSESETKIGFLYSWNYMITKRWKNSGTVDENFMRKVMRDFRAFCSNQNNRLEDFWKCSLMSCFSQEQSLNLSLES